MTYYSFSPSDILSSSSSLSGSETIAPGTDDYWEFVVPQTETLYFTQSSAVSGEPLVEGVDLSGGGAYQPTEGMTLSPGTYYLDLYNSYSQPLSYTIQLSTTANTHTAPTVNVQNISVAETTPIAASSMITSVNNPSGDSITKYGFYDAGSGNGHLTLNGTVEPDDYWVDVSTGSLSSVQYVGGSSPGSEPLYVDVYDATTGTWSVSSSLTATTTASHVAPTVTAVASVTVTENEAIAASSLISSITNPSNDSITLDIFKDDGGGSGYFTVNGVHQLDGSWIYPNPGDTVDYVGGPSPGTDTLEVGIYDYTTNSYSYAPAPVVASTTAPAYPSGIDYRLGQGDPSALTGINLSAIKADKYGFVAEYIGNAPDDGYLTHQDASALSGDGIPIVSIFERNPSSIEYFTTPHANSDAQDAITAAENVAGQPQHTVIYFTIDPAEEAGVYSGYGPLSQTYITAIESYFEGRGFK